MADLRSYNHDLVLEIVHCFKEQECLWLYTSRDYKNKVLKVAAYKKLLQIQQKHDPTCTITDVKKFIQSLRAPHRKERKKVQASMRTGSGADEVYKPKLWYYTELEFLNDQMENTSSVSTLDENENIDIGEDSNATMTTSETEIMAPSSVSSMGVSSPSEPSPRTISQRSHKKLTEQEQRQQIMAKISKKLENTEDDFDVVGKNIANKLRAMDPDQRIHAEKIINDALYYGTVKHLTFDSCITGTVRRTTTVVEQPNPCSTPFASQATYSQSATVHPNYSIVPNNNNVERPFSCNNPYSETGAGHFNYPIVPNNNNVRNDNTVIQSITQPETATLNTESSLQTIRF